MFALGGLGMDTVLEQLVLSNRQTAGFLALFLFDAAFLERYLAGAGAQASAQKENIFR